MHKRHWPIALTPLFALLLCCSDDGYNKYPTVDANPGDDSGQQDARPIDSTPLPDRIVNPDGPTITILAPTPNAVVAGSQMNVEAQITDDDSEVDPSSVRAYVTAEDSHPLGRQAAGSNVYEGLVDISALGDGEQVVVVVAADLQGNTNSAEVRFVRDTGPIVTFFAPEENERYVDSVNLSFEVRDSDGVREDSVIAVIGPTALPIVKSDEDDASPPTWITFNYNIVFDDSIFNPPLRGSQMIQVDAENTNNTGSSTTLTFMIDQEGPQIDVLTPTPGEIVGGIMDIEVSVSDGAGIAASSVVAVLAGDQISRSKVLEPSGSYFTTSFDTRVFPDTYVFPSLSVRAADTLGNESDVGFLLSLDNQAPIVSLDPPDDYRVAVKNEGNAWMCSAEFDPVGSDAANHATRVPQVFYLRARVEDTANMALGLVQPRASLINYSTVKLYMLDDTENHPLVVDTDGDGYCDEINPNLVPTTTPQASDEVLVLNLVPIDPAGSADFTNADETNLPGGCDVPGDDTEVPDTLCMATAMTVAVFYTVDVAEPAIYTLEPVDSSSPAVCTGNQFDALANNIGDGWTCASVRAVDNLGNIGVAQPIALCIDHDMDGSPSECLTPSVGIPDCTGTQDPVTLEVTSDPCIFHGEKQRFRNQGILYTP
jgi:hypothetical protein